MRFCAPVGSVTLAEEGLTIPTGAQKSQNCSRRVYGRVVFAEDSLAAATSSAVAKRLNISFACVTHVLPKKFTVIILAAQPAINSM